MSNLPEKYVFVLSRLKDRIRNARWKAVLTANRELLTIYWEIGMVILDQQSEKGWGAKVIDRLSADLKSEFTDLKGLSSRNLKYMRAFAEAYPEFVIGQQSAAQLQNIGNQDNEIVQQVAAQLPWGHHQVILDKVKNKEKRLFYISKAVENGWSRNILFEQIESKLHERNGKALTNFSTTLPAMDSDLAIETLKNPYVFDFLTLGEKAKEKDVERTLIAHLKKFMLELGKGFAYVGNQYNLKVEGDDFFLDLLFFNTNLNCFVIFELKIGEFKPEFTGKLNFYINTVNEKVKGKNHKPTIGVLLCKTPNETVVKYSLAAIDQPIGVADYKLAQALPKNIKGEMPTMEELEKELDEEYLELKRPADKKAERLKELLKGLNQEKIIESKNTDRTKQIFNGVLLSLRNDIELDLKKHIAPLFINVSYSLCLGNRNYNSIIEAQEHLAAHPSEPVLGLDFCLEGFTHPKGVDAFSCNSGIRIYLYEFKYVIVLRHSKKSLVEKLYRKLPNKSEFKIIVQAVHEEIFDETVRNLERIQQEEKGQSQSR